jgi:aspartokinase
MLNAWVRGPVAHWVMNNMMTESIPIGGIKISSPVLALRLRTDPASFHLTARLCCLLTIARVNIAFMTSAGQGDACHALCCIDPAQRDKVAQLVEQDAELRECVTFGRVLGLLTIYPHRASLKMLGLALQAMSGRGIRIHGLASSISSLTFAIDHSLLEDAAVLLSSHCDALHQPTLIKSDFTVRQEKRSP